MNKQQINDFRVAHGLAPLPVVSSTAQKRKQAANQAARAQASRDLRNLRSTKIKGK